MGETTYHLDRRHAAKDCSSPNDIGVQNATIGAYANREIYLPELFVFFCQGFAL